MRRDHVLRALDENVRYDGRELQEYRDVKVETGVSKTAEGSARVTMGDTVVMVGVKLSVETPYPDKPNAGTFMVNAELLPMASSEYESGPPGPEAIELARVIDRSVRESGAIDFEALCIEPGEKVWSVLCDVVPINDAGNLYDAASIGLAAALQDTKMLKLDDEKNLDYKTKTDEGLPLTDTPVAVTVWKLGDNLFVDPLSSEQEVMDARLTVGTLSDGNICALQKGGDGPIMSEDVSEMVGLAKEKADMLRGKL